MNPEVSISSILEERTPKNDGTYPVKIRITHRRNQRYFSTGVSVTKDDFQKMMFGNPRGDLKDNQLYVYAYQQKAVDVIKAMDDFSFDEFKKRFLGDQEKSKSIQYLFQQYINLLNKEKRVATAASYTSALNSITDVGGKKNLALTDITPDFLKRYEKSMLEAESSITTVGVYLRSLRTILNIAKSDGMLTEQEYPFGRYKYVIPSPKNIKKALSESSIKKLFNYIPQSGGEVKAKDYWILIYLCNGINMKDIALLKNRNINRDTISFSRAKTENTARKNLKPITVHLSKEIQEVMYKWKEQGEADDYVFPILKKGMTAQQERKTISQFIKITNKYLDRIGKAIGVEQKLTTYSARHSYATLLKRSGVPLAYISDSLGHKDIKTTENYFDGFEDNAKKHYSSLLTKFLKPEHGKGKAKTKAKPKLT